MGGSRQLSAIASGLISAGLFLLIYGFGTGMVFMLVPALPLLMIGLRWGLVPLSLAAFVGALTVLLVTNEPGLTRFYLAFLAVPSLLFAPRALLMRDGQPLPMGEILTDLSIYAALVMAGVILDLTGSGGLQAMVNANIGKGFANDPKLMAEVQEFAADWLFVGLAASAGCWVVLFYAHGWLAGLMLKNRGMTTRESFLLQPFTIPVWMLGLLAGAALFTFHGVPDIALTARTVFVIFLLPYFLLGTSILHLRAKAWPNRGVLLFLIYFTILVAAWPALFIAGMGLWRQMTSFKPSNPKT